MPEMTAENAIEKMREANYIMVRQGTAFFTLDVWAASGYARKRRWDADTVHGLLRNLDDARVVVSCVRQNVFCVLLNGAHFAVTDMKAPAYMMRGTWQKVAHRKWEDVPGWRNAEFDVNAERVVKRGDDHDFVWVNAYYSVREVEIDA